MKKLRFMNRNKQSQSQSHSLPKLSPSSSQPVRSLGDSTESRSLKSQLAYMIQENENLNKEVSALNLSLKKNESTLQEINNISLQNQSMDKVSQLGTALLERLKEENEDLKEELTDTKSERDIAIKQVLLLKQVAQFYKEKDEEEQRVVENRLFVLQQLLQKKDNIIQHLQNQIEVLKEDNIAKKVKIIEKLVFEPGQWIREVNKNLEKKQAEIAELQKANQTLTSKLHQKDFECQNLKVELKKFQQISQVLAREMKNEEVGEMGGSKGKEVLLEQEISNIAKQADQEKVTLKKNFTEIQKNLKQMQEQKKKEEKEKYESLQTQENKTLPKADLNQGQLTIEASNGEESDEDESGGEDLIQKKVPEEGKEEPFQSKDQGQNLFKSISKSPLQYVEQKTDTHEEQDKNKLKDHVVPNLATADDEQMLSDSTLKGPIFSAKTRTIHTHQKHKGKIPKLNFGKLNVRGIPKKPPVPQNQAPSQKPSQGPLQEAAQDNQQVKPLEGAQGPKVLEEKPGENVISGKKGPMQSTFEPIDDKDEMLEEVEEVLEVTQEEGKEEEEEAKGKKEKAEKKAVQEVEVKRDVINGRNVIVIDGGDFSESSRKSLTQEIVSQPFLSMNAIGAPQPQAPLESEQEIIIEEDEEEEDDDANENVILSAQQKPKLVNQMVADNQLHQLQPKAKASSQLEGQQEVMVMEEEEEEDSKGNKIVQIIYQKGDKKKKEASEERKVSEPKFKVINTTVIEGEDGEEIIIEEEGEEEDDEDDIEVPQRSIKIGFGGAEIGQQKPSPNFRGLLEKEKGAADLNKIVMKGIEKILSPQQSENEEVIVEEEEEEEDDHLDRPPIPKVTSALFGVPLGKEGPQMEVTEVEEEVVEEEVEEEVTSMNNRLTTEDINVDMKRKMEQTYLIQKGNVISNPKPTSLSQLTLEKDDGEEVVEEIVEDDEEDEEEKEQVVDNREQTFSALKQQMGVADPKSRSQLIDKTLQSQIKYQYQQQHKSHNLQDSSSQSKKVSNQIQQFSMQKTSQQYNQETLPSQEVLVEEEVEEEEDSQEEEAPTQNQIGLQNSQKLQQLQNTYQKLEEKLKEANSLSSSAQKSKDLAPAPVQEIKPKVPEKYVQVLEDADEESQEQVIIEEEEEEDDDDDDN